MFVCIGNRTFVDPVVTFTKNLSNTSLEVCAHGQTEAVNMPHEDGASLQDEYMIAISKPNLILIKFKKEAGEKPYVESSYETDELSSGSEKVWRDIGEILERLSPRPESLGSDESSGPGGTATLGGMGTSNAGTSSSKTGSAEAKIDGGGTDKDIKPAGKKGT